MSQHDLSVKGGTSERCYHTRCGRTNEQRYAIISPKKKINKWSMGSKFFQNRKNSIWYSMFFTFPTIFHYISWVCFFNPQRGIACFPSQNMLHSGNPRFVVDCRGNPSRKTRQHSMDWYTAHVYFVQSF